MENERDRRALTTEEQEKLRFWVEALLRDSNPERAARELFAIGVRTRGAVRTRGSVSHAAPSRFPTDTVARQILELFQRDSSPTLRSAVAGALAEMGGQEAVPVLKRLAVGSERDADAGVRAAALDATGIIGGPDALAALEAAAESDPDPTVQSVAVGLIASLGEREPVPAVEVLQRLVQKLSEGTIQERVVAALKALSHSG